MILEVACPIPIFKTFDYKPPTNLNGTDPQSLIGRRVKIHFGFKQQVGMICNVKETSDAPLDKLKPVTQLLDEEPMVSKEMMALAEWLSHRYASSLGEALFALLPPSSRRVSGRDPVSLSVKTLDSGLRRNDDAFSGPRPTFTREQQAAIQTITQSIQGNKPDAFLLHGVAAARKTEVYMAAIDQVIKKGKTALLLSPEIGLSIQTYNVLCERFGKESVLLWHSNVTQKERIQNWWRIKNGEFPIVMGPRTAVLAPLSNLGLIVVDEEHDTSYKEDRKPRFHARDVAYWRAKNEGAISIFGSATPSLESTYLAKQKKLHLLEIQERAIPAEAPQVHLIDMNKEKTKWALSTELLNAIDESHKNKERAILFLNKRGFSRFLRCSHCSWVAKCKTCDVALVFHRGKDDKGLMCHYCTKGEPVPKKCPSCKEAKLYYGGFGTQKIEEELKQRLPWAHVLRWDRDSAQKRGAQEKLLKKFNSGTQDILVGTQMVAHGFNFTHVNLVGAIDADSALYIPDFRAAERTFQTITQVAGRAGREMKKGTVFIQTRHPDHYSLQYAFELDYNGFSDYELKHREELNYPPYSHLIEIIAEAKKAGKAQKAIDAMADWLWDLKLAEPIGILGPSKPKREKKGGLERHQLLLKVPDVILDDFLKLLRNYVGPKISVFAINVDPE